MQEAFKPREAGLVLQDAHASVQLVCVKFKIDPYQIHLELACG